MLETFVEAVLAFQVSCSTILQNWYFFLYLLLLQVAFASLISRHLSGMISSKNSLSILSFLGGGLGTVLFSLSLILFRVKPSPLAGLVFIPVALLIIIWNRRSLNTLFAPEIMLFFLFILLQRMIFVQGLLVPPYADSVTHLQIVSDLMNPDRPPQAFYQPALDWEHFYHFGFHSLAAWLSGATSTDPAQALLLLGQYFQALAVLALYPVSRLLSGNSSSAWTTMTIAGLLLPMPAYASNWGKYPAIASISGISFILALFVSLLKNKIPESRKGWWLLGFAITTTVFLHSRSLIAIAVFTITYYWLLRLDRQHNLFLIEKKFIEHKTMITLVINTLLLFLVMAFFEYEVPFWLFFGLVLIFTFAFYANLDLTLHLTMAMFIIGILHYLPLHWLGLPERFNMAFDRPYLLILFYLPISILIETGLKGMVRLLRENKIHLSRHSLFTGILIVGLVYSIFIRDNHSSSCCVFLDDDDLFSFQWMQQNLPADALVGISANGQPGNFLPADGGAWIEYFTGMPTRKLDSGTNFVEEAKNLCGEGITYYYVDNLENSFDEFNLLEAGGLYQFGLGDVRIYKLECLGDQ